MPRRLSAAFFSGTISAMKLCDFFKEYPEVAVAFSGGVDSSYLLFMAARHARRVTAYYAKSAFQPQFELEDARRVAEQTGTLMREIPIDVLAAQEVASNPSDRCYYCKKRIFSAIISEAASDGYYVILDGTNASDDAGDRPGMKALTELEVLSPLRMCGLTKDEIRRLSRKAGLPTWDKPAYACLATRIPEGTRITAELLARTERAEKALMELGFSDFRVRTRDGGALLQITAGQAGLYEARRSDVEQILTEEYGSYTLDPVYRNGQ